MRKQRLLLLTVIAFTLLSFTGCGKDDPQPAPAAKTKTELITLSPWKFQSATASGTDISAYPQLACYTDNVTTFASNLSFTINEGANICTPSTAGTFTWSFQSGETLLQLSIPIFAGGSTSFTIVSLNETNLVISQNVVIPPSPVAIPVQFTFKH
jgi:predicted small lipoprotein YifL